VLCGLRQGGLVGTFTVPYVVDMCPAGTGGQCPAAYRPVMLVDHTIVVISGGQTSSSVVFTLTRSDCDLTRGAIAF
jgi:hypothetical protein